MRAANQKENSGAGAPFDDPADPAAAGCRRFWPISLARQPRSKSQRARDRVIVVVDSSVWIDFLNGRNAPHVQRLRTLIGNEEIIVGDLMLCEVLQGLENEQAAQEVEALLRRFEIVSIASEAVAITAARNFRTLRERGVTIRKTIDLLIGTWCIQNRRPLLHNDADFHPMAQHLGLTEVAVTS